MTAVKRVLEADRLNYVPAEGYLLFVTDTNLIYAGDGSTAGGILMGNIEFATSTTVVVSGGPSLSTSTVQDIVGDLIVNGGYDGISFTYDTVNNVLTGTVDIQPIQGSLSGDLSLGGYIITGTGVIQVTGDIHASSSISTDIAPGSYMTSNAFTATSHVHTPAIRAPSSFLKIESSEESIDEMTVRVEDKEKVNLVLRRTDPSTDLTAISGHLYGRISFEKDDINGLETAGVLNGTSDSLFLAFLSGGVRQSNIACDADGVTIGAFHPAASGIDFDINGVMRLSPLTTAPTNVVAGAIAVADGNTAGWDPKGTNTGVPYPMFFDGTNWISMTA